MKKTCAVKSPCSSLFPFKNNYPLRVFLVPPLFLGALKKIQRKQPRKSKVQIRTTSTLNLSDLLLSSDTLNPMKAGDDVGRGRERLL